MDSNVRKGMAYVHSVYTTVAKRTYAEGGMVHPAPDPAHADGRWVWFPTRRWVDDGSTHPRDTDGDPT